MALYLIGSTFNSGDAVPELSVKMGASSGTVSSGLHLQRALGTLYKQNIDLVLWEYLWFHLECVSCFKFYFYPSIPLLHHKSSQATSALSYPSSQGSFS